MKNFKELLEAPAQDYVVKKDDDKEATMYKPRAKGEEDFAKETIVMKHTKHPVAGDHQFDGSRNAVREGFASWLKDN